MLHVDIVYLECRGSNCATIPFFWRYVFVSCLLSLSRKFSMNLACLQDTYYNQFYHGYCKDQRNAAVITLRYFTLRHDGLWEAIHIHTFGTIWRNPCFWNSKSCQLHVISRFRFDLVYFVVAWKKSHFRWSVAVPNQPSNLL